jgi:hypothetical protein
VHANQLYARELVLGCAHVDLGALRQSQALTQFTCFTSTNVQMLTLSPLLCAADGNTSKAGAAPPAGAPGGRDTCRGVCGAADAEVRA